MLRSFLYKDNFFVGHPQMIMIFLIEACYAYIPKIKSAVMVIVLRHLAFTIVQIQKDPFSGVP